LVVVPIANPQHSTPKYSTGSFVAATFDEISHRNAGCHVKDGRLNECNVYPKIHLT
jgi:hypothetical protein